MRPRRQLALTGTLALILLQGCGWNPFGTKEAYLRRGADFVQKGKFEDAALQYTKALQKDRNYGEAYLRYGQLFILQNKTQQAIPHFARAVELMRKSETAKTELGRAAVSALLQDPRRSALLYRAASSMASQLLAANAASFEGLRIKGYLAVADGHPKDAVEWFKKSLAAKQDQRDVVTVLVQTLLFDGQGAEAEKMALNALPTAKTYGPLYDALYGYYMATGRAGEAEKLLRSKIAANPKVPFYAIQLADHYWGQKQRPLAEEVLRSCAPLEAGDFYERTGNLDEAVRLYQKGLESDRPRKKDYLRRLVSARLAQGRNDEAAKLLEAILKEYPADLDALAARADLQMASGKPEEMRKALADLGDLVKNLGRTKTQRVRSVKSCNATPNTAAPCGRWRTCRFAIRNRMRLCVTPSDCSKWNPTTRALAWFGPPPGHSGAGSARFAAN
jgi:tetratricopeptide (TPR) repeat protein